METAKLFMNGRSQAVRLPKDYRFEGDEVYVKRVGNAVVLLPHDAPWDVLFASLADFSDDFMAERVQPQQSRRDEVFE